MNALKAAQQIEKALIHQFGGGSAGIEAGQKTLNQLSECAKRGAIGAVMEGQNPNVVVEDMLATVFGEPHWLATDYYL